MTLEKALDLIWKLQEKYPTLHVGGSIGLYLHGIDLGRREFNDIDFVIDKDLFSDTMDENFNSGNDFDYVKEVKGISYEIRVDGAQTFCYKRYNNRNYQVSQLETIIRYKENYARKGYPKHQEDLVKIYNVIGKPVTVLDYDDLPF